MKKIALILSYFIFAVLLFSGCSSSNSASAQYLNQDYYQPQVLPAVNARLSGQNLELMLAKTDYQRAKGLMFYDEIATYSGMLFVYDTPHQMSFWMMNTKIPLDLIFFSEELRVTEYINNMLPGYGKPANTLPHYQSVGTAQYALELKAGSIERFNIKVGDKLDIPKILLELP